MPNPHEPYYEFRGALADRLLRDMIGPADTEELIEDAPLTHYISGILYPQQSGLLDPSADIDRDDEDESDGSVDPPVALANVRYPSSFGLTCASDANVSRTIDVLIGGARYKRIEQEESAPAEEQDQPRRAAASSNGAGSRWSSSRSVSTSRALRRGGTQLLELTQACSYASERLTPEVSLPLR